MKIVVIISSILILLLLGYCFVMKRSPLITVPSPTMTENPPQQEKSVKPFVIIAFGDSLTAGYGVTLDESYPMQLEKELQKRRYNIRVINMGVSGETTTAGLERVPFILSQKPNLVLLGLGANDMLRSSSPQITKQNLASILEQFKTANIPVVMLGMKSTSSNDKEYINTFNAIYPFLAKEYTLPFVPFFLEGVALIPILNTGDGIHPNKIGYEYIIKNNILPVLIPTLEKII